MEYLVSFIVIDDQVDSKNLVFFLALTDLQSIHIIKCPEFQQLCMVLHETLTMAEIPGHFKMREAIISCWKASFKKLKVELSVSSRILPLLYESMLTLINRNPVDGLVSQQTFGQMGI
jgi:hypothetical protein